MADSLRRRITFAVVLAAPAFALVLVAACSSFDASPGDVTAPPSPTQDARSAAEEASMLEPQPQPQPQPGDGGVDGAPPSIGFCVASSAAFCLDFDGIAPLSDPDAGLLVTTNNGAMLGVTLGGLSPPNRLFAALGPGSSHAFETLTFRAGVETTRCEADVYIDTIGATPTSLVTLGVGTNGAQNAGLGSVVTTSVANGEVGIALRDDLKGLDAGVFATAPSKTWFRLSIAFESGGITARASTSSTASGRVAGAAPVKAMVWGPNSAGGTWKVAYDNLTCTNR